MRDCRARRREKHLGFRLSPVPMAGHLSAAAPCGRAFHCSTNRLRARETIGREVGWHVRFEKRFVSDTKLVVATEGILTARLQSDPLLSDFTTIVLTSFTHGASMPISVSHWRSRPGALDPIFASSPLSDYALREPVSAFLDGCPVIEVQGTQHPTSIDYAPGQSVEDAALELMGRTSGDVLCFLPGAREISMAVSALESRVPGDTRVLPLMAH